MHLPRSLAHTASLTFFEMSHALLLLDFIGFPRLVFVVIALPQTQQVGDLIGGPCLNTVFLAVFDKKINQASHLRFVVSRRTVEGSDIGITINLRRKGFGQPPELFLSVIVFPRETKELDCLVKYRNNNVIPSNVANILPIDLDRRYADLRRELAAQLPKISVGVLAPLLTVNSNLDVKILSVQLVPLRPKIAVNFERKPLLGISYVDRKI